MKKFIIILLILCPMLLIGQGVAINTNNAPANENAILDVSSDSKGILLPRLTTQQRTNIVSPVPGLTVFDKSTFSYWVYLGDLNGGWHEIQTTLDKHWDRTGFDVFNLNLGNIGIGTSNPNHKLTVNDNNPAIELMHNGVTSALLQAEGSNLKLGTHVNNTFGDIIFNTNGTDRMWINDNGRVGIGTSSPSSVLTIDGFNPWLELKNGGIDKGYVWASGNDLKVGTNAGNTTGNVVFQTKIQDRMVIDEDGRVGIGTSNPNPSSILTIDDNDPMIQLENNGTAKGFIQLVDDNIRVGTNASNTDGNFIVRTNGVDRLTVTDQGNLFFNSSNSGLFFKINSLTKASINADNTDFTMSRPLSGNGGKIKITNGPTSGIYISEDGHTNIGSGSKPEGYRLSVQGKAIATEFTALDIQDWPDYVFAEEYNLRSIEEVKEYISINHHLPNIPSAKEMETTGVELGKMSKSLMEKVEELTLYVIQLNDQNKILQQQIEDLQKGIE